MGVVLSLFHLLGKRGELLKSIIAIHISVDHSERLFTQEAQGERNTARRFQVPRLRMK